MANNNDIRDTIKVGVYTSFLTAPNAFRGQGYFNQNPELRYWAFETICQTVFPKRLAYIPDFLHRFSHWDGFFECLILLHKLNIPYRMEYETFILEKE